MTTELYTAQPETAAGIVPHADRAGPGRTLGAGPRGRADPLPQRCPARYQRSGAEDDQ